jgi:hypothetical protein
MNKPIAKTAAQRKAAEADRKKAIGLVRRGVWAHPDDWGEITKLVEELTKKRLTNSLTT